MTKLTGLHAVVSGWGRTKYVTISNDLWQARMKIGRTPRWFDKRQIIYLSQKNSKAVCNGDSGGT